MTAQCPRCQNPLDYHGADWWVCTRCDWHGRRRMPRATDRLHGVDCLTAAILAQNSPRLFKSKRERRKD